MTTAKLRFKRLPNGVGLPLPSYATAGAAGMDICSAETLDGRSGWLYAGHRRLVRTGFAVEIPAGHELQVRPRSGMANRDGVTVLNSPGTIDADFRGELCVILINHGHGQLPVTITRGDRIAQLVLAPVIRAEVVEVEELSESVRGVGGFGSTGT